MGRTATRTEHGNAGLRGILMWISVGNWPLWKPRGSAVYGNNLLECEVVSIDSISGLAVLDIY
jgi:hypothetical protein